jgi:hypothetical protein
VIAFQMFFFAGFAFAAAAVFKLYVRRYKVVDNYRTSEAAKAAAARAGKGDAEAEPLPEARVHKDDDRT